MDQGIANRKSLQQPLPSSDCPPALITFSLKPELPHMPYNGMIPHLLMSQIRLDVLAEARAGIAYRGSIGEFK